MLNIHIKKQGHDVHYNDNHRLSSGDESPDEHESPMASNGEVDDKLRMAAELLWTIILMFFLLSKKEEVGQQGYRCGSQVPRTQNTCGAWLCTENCTALENVLYKTEISHNLFKIKKSDTSFNFNAKSTSLPLGTHLTNQSWLINVTWLKTSMLTQLKSHRLGIQLQWPLW